MSSRVSDSIQTSGGDQGLCLEELAGSRLFTDDVERQCLYLDELLAHRFRTDELVDQRVCTNELTMS